MSNKSNEVVLLLSASGRHRVLVNWEDAESRAMQGAGSYEEAREVIHARDALNERGKPLLNERGKKQKEFAIPRMGEDGKRVCPFCKEGRCRDVQVRVFHYASTLHGPGQRSSGISVKAKRNGQKRDFHKSLLREVEPSQAQIDGERRELLASADVQIASRPGRSRYIPPHVSSPSLYVPTREHYKGSKIVAYEPGAEYSPLPSRSSFKFDEVDKWIRLAELELKEARNNGGVEAERKLFQEWRQMWQPELEKLSKREPGWQRHVEDFVGPIKRFLKL